METRKVQRTGKSTFIVSLPKNWATRHGIEAGSIIYISQTDNGSLVMTPDRSERDLSIKLDIGEKSGEPLIRDLIGCYVSGYRAIEITSAHMSSAQKKDLHHIVQKLIGPEILEETQNKVLIQDLLSSEELQAERALRRIRTVVKSMIQDSIAALLTDNKDLALDVIHRDNDVDRLELLISRQFTEILRSGSIKHENLDPLTALNYMLAASNMERIADHACRIADTAIRSDFALPEGMRAELRQLESAFGSLLDDAVSSLLNKKLEKANEIIDKTTEFQKLTSNIANYSQSNGREQLMVRLLVSSSMERMLDYIRNIGELTINLAHANLTE
jgi:phosphate uptake regulator